LRIHDAIPASVADGVVARWAGLSPTAQQVLLVASVAGHRLDLALLASASGNSTQALGRSSTKRFDVRLVREETSDEPLRFRHALTREALQQQLLRSERAALHGTIAAFLEARRETARSARPSSPTTSRSPGKPAKASRYHEMAASEAAAITDFGSAARSMERAIATAPGGDFVQARRQLALVNYLRMSGNDPRASAPRPWLWRSVSGWAMGSCRGRALLALQAGYLLNSEVAKGHDLVQRAVVLLEPLGPTPELARAYSSIAGSAARLGDATTAMAFAEQARVTATTLALPAELSYATPAGLDRV